MSCIGDSGAVFFYHTMKALKIIFYVIAGMILSVCAFVLVCAMNPPLSQKVSGFLYGDDNHPGVTKMLSAEWLKEHFKLPFSFIKEIDLPEIPGNADELPEFSISTLPDGVGILTGYRPVESVEVQVSDDDAKELRDEIGTGNTGEALDFDAVLYPYYEMLTDAERDIYKQIYANASEVKSLFAPVNSITTTELKRAYEAVVNDHPELFYLETSYAVKYDKSGKVVELTLSYYTIVNDLTAAKDKFNSAANSIIAGAQNLETDYEKEKYVHDALVASVMYDDTAAMGQSAYSALVNGKTVCAGYARANQYILQKLGIPCYYCTGYSGQNHAWNIVKLGDGYYNEDITWDDTVPTTYNYFNCTDSDFSSSHVRTGMSVNLPKCDSYTYRGLESGAVAEVTIPEGTTVDGEVVHPKPLRYDEVYGNNSNSGSGSSSGSYGGSSSNSSTGSSGSSGTTGSNGTTNPEDAEAIHQYQLEKLAELGLKESDASWNMDEYYTKCKNDLISAGTGDKHFYVIIPESLYDSVERAYSTDEYKTGYADAALDSLGMNKISIQIQVQRLGNGFYKLYHNVYTWKE